MAHSLGPPGVARPLAAVMVTEPDPITVHGLRTLAAWCDVVVQEGTRTFAGEAREPLRQDWHDLTGIPAPQLRVVTAHLRAGAKWRTQAVQRNSLIPVLLRESVDRPVLLCDSDELLDPDSAPEALAAAIATRQGPVRLPLVSLWGGVDRVAPAIHCCAHASDPALRDPEVSAQAAGDVPGPVLTQVADLLMRQPDEVRRTSPAAAVPALGWHLTMTAQAEQEARKLAATAHQWYEVVRDPRHLDTMLSAGVHPAGWWIASYRSPEPWLSDLAARARRRTCGPVPHPRRLRGLRAWAQARLDPGLDPDLVRAGDQHLSRERSCCADLLRELDVLQLQFPPTWRGTLDADSPGVGQVPHGPARDSGAIAGLASHFRAVRTEDGSA